MSCAIGTKFKDVRKRLFQKHTLDAVFSMPEDIFYPIGTNVCVMVWKAHRPHDSTRETFGRWAVIQDQWLKLYRNRDVEDGLSARHSVTDTDEWLCEAYMKTDYSKITQDDFQQTLNNYLAYLVQSGDVHES